MGINIGGALRDVGSGLPKIDLGKVGKSALGEGKKLLGEIVQDTFTPSAKPASFASKVNILGDSARLPNPIGSLAGKLFGSVDASAPSVPALKARVASGPLPSVANSPEESRVNAALSQLATQAARNGLGTIRG